MKTLPMNRKYLTLILVAILVVAFGIHCMSYAQEANPTITASVEAPLSEATLSGSVVTLRLSGQNFDDEYDVSRALTISGIDGVAFERWDVERVSDMVVTVPLTFSGNIDTDAPLTFTIEARGITGYDGEALTAQLPVTAVEESLIATTDEPITEATLNGGIIILTLSGRHFARRRWDIEDAVSFSGVEGVSISTSGIDRISDTVVTVELSISGNIDEDGVLTITVGADAIAGYNQAFTVQLPFTAVEESLEASTEAPLTEATLHGSVVTLTLSGRIYESIFDLRDSVTVTGIDRVSFEWHDVDRVNDTVVAVELSYSGNIDEDGTLTVTVGADAIVNYEKDFTFQFTVPAVEESMTATTDEPLTEATLHGSTITFTLTGRRFADWSTIEDAVSVSGIEGVRIGWRDQDVVSRDVRGGIGTIRVLGVTDTKVTMAFRFAGNIDVDTTLTVTVGADAINYDKDFTFEFNVTASEESVTASTAAILTEANLDGSIVTLTLAGRHFADGLSDWRTVEDYVTVSGIEGVTILGSNWDSARVSDTEIAVRLEFNGTDFDTDATLTFQVNPRITNHSQTLTAQLRVTAIQQSNATVSLSPSTLVSPNIGEQLTFSINITDGENVAGYQVTVRFDDSALDYMESANDDYLPADAFFMDPVYGYTLDGRSVTLAATRLAGASNGDGTLATITFEVVAFKASSLTLSKAYLVDTDGNRWETELENAEITLPPEPAEPIFGDINHDGVVNIQDLVIVGTRLGQRGQNSADVNGDGLVDIVDIVLVANAMGADAAAPSMTLQLLELLSASDVKEWLNQANLLSRTDAAYLRGLAVLEQLLTVLTPKQTALLPNFPNPFNPETWIPYHLSNDVDVYLSIYNMKGILIRRLDLGHQTAGYYTDRTKAAYWNGKNEFGEQAASGMYFYHLSAGDYSATRKMLIVK